MLGNKRMEISLVKTVEMGHLKEDTLITLKTQKASSEIYKI